MSKNKMPQKSTILSHIPTKTNALFRNLITQISLFDDTQNVSIKIIIKKMLTYELLYDNIIFAVAQESTGK